MEKIKVMQFALCLCGVFLSGMLFQISLPFIKNWFKNKFGKTNIKKLNEIVLEIVKSQSINDILKEKGLEKYNNIPDNKKYEFIQLLAKREKFKKAIKIIDEQIKQIEKKIPFKTTKGGDYEID